MVCLYEDGALSIPVTSNEEEVKTLKWTVEETKKLVSKLRGRKSQEEFARELEISYKTVANWECGNFTPSQICQRLLREYAERHNIEMPEFI